MSSKIDICNHALGLVAEQRITTIDDNNEPARLCKLHLESTVREVLSLADWRSARRRAVLAKLTAAPAFGYANQFVLPAGWLRTVSFNDVYQGYMLQELFTIEDGNLLTDESTVSLLYIQDVTIITSDGGYGKLDALLARTIEFALAAKLAWPLQQNATLMEKLEQQFEQSLIRAKGKNARDGFDSKVASSSQSEWNAARSTGTGA